jgi:hypothetical protein
MFSAIQRPIDIMPQRVNSLEEGLQQLQVALNFHHHEYHCSECTEARACALQRDAALASAAALALRWHFLYQFFPLHLRNAAKLKVNRKTVKFVFATGC